MWSIARFGVTSPSGLVADGAAGALAEHWIERLALPDIGPRICISVISDGVTRPDWSLPAWISLRTGSLARPHHRQEARCRPELPVEHYATSQSTMPVEEGSQLAARHAASLL
jgi:hypothetical protein